MALWDIKAKVAGLPLYQLAGRQAAATACMVYGHANGDDIDETVDEVAALSWSWATRRSARRAGVPGARQAPMASRRDTDVLRAGRRGPADREGLVDAASISTSRRSCSRPRATRSASAAHLLHDVHHRLTPIEAARLGKALEPYRLFWLEDATPAENQEAFRLIRQHTTTPLAVGEIFNTIWDCKHLIEEQLIDYIRATVVHAGGITHLRRIADFAELYQVRTGCHGATDLSPVCMGAALHFDIWVPNFGIQEYMRHTAGDRRGLPARLPLRGRLLCIRATRRATAWRSTRRWPRNTPTSAPICRSTGSRTAPCGTGGWPPSTAPPRLSPSPRATAAASTWPAPMARRSLIFVLEDDIVRVSVLPDGGLNVRRAGRSRRAPRTWPTEGRDRLDLRRFHPAGFRPRR